MALLCTSFKCIPQLLKRINAMRMTQGIKLTHYASITESSNILVSLEVGQSSNAFFVQM